MSDLYEVYAIRYATRDAKRADHFIGGDPHDAPMPMDYFVWVAKSPSTPSSSTRASRRRSLPNANALTCVAPSIACS